MNARSIAWITGLLAEAERAKQIPSPTGSDLLGRFVDGRRARGAEMTGAHSVAGAVGLCGEFTCHTRETSRETALLLVDSGASCCPRCALWHFPTDHAMRDLSVVRVCVACGGER